jgi:hypothetical protein
VRIAGLLVALAGCDLVFSLDAPVPPVRPPIDHVTIDVTLRWVENDAAGLPVLHDDPFDLPIAVRLTDGSTPDVVQDGPGAYSFETDNLAYTLTLESPRGPFVIDHFVPAVTIALPHVGRLDAAPFTAPTTVTVTPSSMVDSTELVHTTGVWSTSENASFEWGGRGHTIFGTRGLLDAARNDRLYYVGYSDFTNDTGTPHVAAASFFEASVTLAEGSTATVVGTPIVPQAACVRVTAERQRQLARISEVAPGTFAPVGADLLIDAIPARELGREGAMLLATQVLVSDISKIDIAYGKLFPDASTIVSLGAVRSRFYKNSLASAFLELFYAVRVFDEVVGTQCPDSSVTLTADMVALIGSISLDGVFLTADEDVLQIENDPIVTWSVSQGPLDHFFVTLFEVVIDQDGTPLEVPIASRFTTDPIVRFDRELFVEGKLYTLHVEARVGTPNAVRGDFSTVSFPNGSSVGTSAVFGVMPTP